MGISATGMTVFTKGNIAKILITFGIFLFLVIFFYGPPIVPALRNAAIYKCNVDQGGDYRSYLLQWRSLSFSDISLPHWECSNKAKPNDPSFNYGWYAGLKF